MMPITMPELVTFVAGFGLAAIGGLAALLRSRQSLSCRKAAASMLYTGMLGLVIALLGYGRFADAQDISALLALCGLSGLGGQSAVDLVLQIFAKGGLSITIQPRSDGEDDKD